MAAWAGLMCPQCCTSVRQDNSTTFCASTRQSAEQSRMSGASRQLAQWALNASRSFAASAAAGPERKVAVLGAAGGIGQPLSLLLKVRQSSSWASPA